MRAPRGLRTLLLVTALVGTTAALTGMGTFATFTGATSGSAAVGAGTVTIALGATGAATNRLTLNATGFYPGGTAPNGGSDRSFDLTNSGTQSLASVTMTTSATASSSLDTDATNGLQMTVDECPSAWSETGTSPNFTYTCGGTVAHIISARAVIGSNLSLGSSLNALSAGGTDHMRVSLTLPASAPSSYQGLSSTIQWSFTGNQRAASNQ